MPEKVNIPGYAYSGERQAVFDAITGKLPEPLRRELPYGAQMLLVAAVVTRDPDTYIDSRGYLKDSLPQAVRSIVGVHGCPSNSAAWTTAARRMGLTEYDDTSAPRLKRVKFVLTEDLKGVLEDLALYYKDPNALTPEGWETARRKAKELRDDLNTNHQGGLITAVAYTLLAESGACQP